jgi:hypothetical protein
MKYPLRLSRDVFSFFPSRHTFKVQQKEPQMYEERVYEDFRLCSILICVYIAWCF